jgi:hypothetical protein
MKTKSVNAGQTPEKIKISKHLLSDKERERIFQNTDVKALRFKKFRSYFFWLLPIFIGVLYNIRNLSLSYMTLTGYFCILFLIVFVFLAQFLRAQAYEVNQQRRNTFDRYGNQDFSFIELTVEKAFLYRNESHLGPYWLGFCGSDVGLLLRGRNLSAFYKTLEKAKLQVVLEKEELENVSGRGPKIPIKVLKSDAVGAAMERLISKKGLPDSLVLKGVAFRSLKKVLLKEIKYF